MIYKKPFISFQTQIDLFKSRGLHISDETYALQFLQANSYYRLRAYTYPFQDNTQEHHPFRTKIDFSDIVDLYKFDSCLRQLLFQSIEKIEVALRTQIIYQFASAFGSHWQLDPNIYRDTSKFAQHLFSLNEEIRRSDETFIKHYTEKYSFPTQPPSWMSLEVASFGLLSKLYQNVKNGSEKKAVAEYVGLKKVDTLENWMFCLSNLRNICAHHGRIWNRRLTSLPQLPYNTLFPFLTKEEIKTIYPNKVYSIICCAFYLLKTIDKENTFNADLIALIKTCPMKQAKEMGFPNGWEQQTIWK